MTARDIPVSGQPRKDADASDLTEEKLFLHRDRPTWGGLLDEVQAFVYGGEPELAVEQELTVVVVWHRQPFRHIAGLKAQTTYQLHRL